MSARSRGNLFRISAIVGLSLFALNLALQATATTRQGINFVTESREIPLYIKSIDFLHRHYAYQRIAREVTAGQPSDQDRALAVFAWTRRTIRPTPKGFPIVDNHVLDIIIRGYGVADQMADVFCTVSTYAGVPAFWEFSHGVHGSPGLVLSFAKIDGAWRVFDVAHGVVFADAEGHLLPLESLLEHPALLSSVTSQAPQHIPYAEYLEELRPFTVPDTLRAEKQMPWPRLVFEIRQHFHSALGTLLQEHSHHRTTL